MTTLVTTELIDTLSQDITYSGEKNIHIYGLKLRLVWFNSPSGTFTVSFKDGATTLASKSFTVADIKTELSTADDYGYIYKGIVFDNPFPIKNGTYQIELSSSGYTFSSDTFLGWAKDYEDNFIQTTDSFTDFSAPRSVLIYTLKRQVQ